MIIAQLKKRSAPQNKQRITPSSGIWRLVTQDGDEGKRGAEESEEDDFIMRSLGTGPVVSKCEEGKNQSNS